MRRFLAILLFLPSLAFGQVTPYVRTGSPGAYIFTLTNSVATGNIRAGWVDAIAAMDEACIGGGPTAPASSGDTIVIPPGDYPYGVQFSGTAWGAQPAAGVTITSSGGPSVTTLEVSGHNTIFYGIILIGTGTTVSGLHFNTATSESDTVISTNGGGWHVKGCTYDNPGSSASYLVRTIGYGGTWDTSTLNGAGGQQELFLIFGPANAWQMSDAQCRASSSVVYIENNHFTGSAYIMDNNANGICVCRFNTADGANQKADCHGFASNSYPGGSPRGCRLTDVYCNSWTYSSAGSQMLEFRGGTGLVFGNLVQNSGYLMLWEDYWYQGLWTNFNIPITGTTGSGIGAVITMASGHKLPLSTSSVGPIGIDSSAAGLYGTYLVNVGSDPTKFTVASLITASPGWPLEDTNVFYVGGPYQCPIQDQVGVGEDVSGPFTGGLGSDPMYAWSNLVSGGGSLARNSGGGGYAPIAASIALYLSETGISSFNSTNVVVEGRDVMSDLGGNVTVGLWASRPGSATTGQGFFATDGGPSGVAWNQSGGVSQGNATSASGQLYVWNGSSWTTGPTPANFPVYSSAPATSSITATNAHL